MKPAGPRCGAERAERLGSGRACGLACGVSVLSGWLRARRGLGLWGERAERPAQGGPPFLAVGVSVLSGRLRAGRWSWPWG